MGHIETIIKEAGIYKHNKSGAVYITLKLAQDEDKNAVVIYFELNKPAQVYTCKIHGFLKQFTYLDEVQYARGN